MIRRPPAHDLVFYVPTVAALLAGDSSRPPGGAETQIRLLARALSQQGVRVALISFAHPGLPASDGDVTVVARAAHADNPLREAWRIAAVLRAVPCQVVVTRQAGAHTGLAALVTRALQRRFVYSVANVMDLDFGDHEASPAKRALFETGLRLAETIVAQTEEQRALCLARRGHSAPVIRSLAEPVSARRGQGECFLWAGRIVDYKQPLAFVELARAVPQARFEMVAVPDEGLDVGGRLLAEVQARAAPLDNLTVLPPCSRVELLERMAGAVAIVSTSTTEGMPNIWLEGWSRGIPALTLSHDPDDLIAHRRLGRSAGGDPGLLAAHTAALWAERADLYELAERCREYVAREHSPVAVAAKWRAVTRV